MKTPYQIDIEPDGAISIFFEPKPEDPEFEVDTYLQELLKSMPVPMPTPFVFKPNSFVNTTAPMPEEGGSPVQAICPICGPTTPEVHPNVRGMVRCSNCKEWLFGNVEHTLDKVRAAIRKAGPSCINDEDVSEIIDEIAQAGIRFHEVP